MGCGVGFFIAFIGFKQLGLIVAHPDTLVTLGKFSPAVIIGLITLFITVVLEIYKIKGAILIGIIAGTCLGIGFDPNVHLPTHIFSLSADVCALAERHKDKATTNADAVKFIFFIWL